jgi:hypothetical protein
MRAVDGWDSSPFSSIFMTSGFSCSQMESLPANRRVTQTVGPLFIKRMCEWKRFEI